MSTSEKKEKPKKPHYVDNKVFLEAMLDWKDLVNEADAEGDQIPPIPEYIGECFYKIATHLSYRPNFINYTYREEMIGDGIENCIQYAKNFNPEKSKNPFAYFTQIIYYAFIRRIQKEKKQQSIKEKLLKESNIESRIDGILNNHPSLSLIIILFNISSDLDGLIVSSFAGSDEITGIITAS